jgi:hypothetical protein
MDACGTGGGASADVKAIIPCGRITNLVTTGHWPLGSCTYSSILRRISSSSRPAAPVGTCYGDSRSQLPVGQ